MGVEPKHISSSDIPRPFSRDGLDSDPLHPYQDEETKGQYLDPSSVAQFFSLDGCPQFFKYEFDDDVSSRVRASRDFKEAFEPLNPLLVKDGNDFEQRVVETLEGYSVRHDNHDSLDDWQDTRRDLVTLIENVADRDPDETDGPVMLTQPRLGGVIGVWPLMGDADIILMWPTEDGVRVRILDVKSSYEKQTYQQIQVSIYTLLMRRWLLLTPLRDSDIDVEIEGGVIHRGESLDGGSPDDLPSFELESRELDVLRTLAKDGEFEQYDDTPNEEIDYQLGNKCTSCAYKEACHVHSLEPADISVLGISRADQNALRENGIETIHDLAELAYPPNNPRPIDYDELRIRDQRTYNQIAESGLGRKIDGFILKAQSFLSEYRPNDMNAYNPDGMPWIIGSGSGNLPEDDPPFDANLDFEEGSMIRTYLHVQHDHRRDRVAMLSAYITASNYDGTETVSKFTQPIPDDPDEEHDAEQELLTEFIEDLYTELENVEDEMSGTGYAPVHFYLYTSHQKTSLVDALKRHREENDYIRSFRDLMGLRGDIDQHQTDQAMLSVVQDELRERVALPHRNYGLIPVVRYVSPYEDHFHHSNWSYERDGEDTEIDLRNAFRTKFFDFRVPFSREDNGKEIRLHLGGENTDDWDSFYPSRVRDGAQIPLQYVWSIGGRLTEDWEDDVSEETETGTQSLEDFIYVDSSEPEGRRSELQKQDIEALGERLAHCVAHVERSLTYRDIDLEKNPLQLSELDQFSHEDFGITRTSLELLDVEFNTNRDDVWRTYAQTVEERVRAGESIPFVIDDIEAEPGGRGIQIEGRTLFRNMFDGDEGEKIANRCRQKGSDGTTSGSWMVMSPLHDDGTPVGDDDPSTLERSPKVTVDTLDLQNSHIELTASEFRTGEKDYVIYHHDWTIGEATTDETVPVNEGSVYLLDPQIDDLNAQRSSEVLSADGRNPIAEIIDGVVNGNRDTLSIDTFNDDAVDTFLSWMDGDDDVTETDGYTPSPNPEQREFTRATDTQVSLLQGPPGTGKTSGTLAPAILSRVYSFSQEQRALTGVVSGASNKAVDEMLEKVAEIAEAYRESDMDSAFDDLLIARLTGEEPDDPVDGVTYINYLNETEELDNLRTRILTGHTGSFADDEAQPHVLLFTTPSRFYGIMDRLNGDLGVEELYEEDNRYFDLLAVDEGSMLQMPQLLLTGAFLNRDAQVMIGGDQRQMPPVQQADWEDITRRTIEEYTPYLSALNYFRFLDGQEVDAVEREEHRLENSVDIPMTQLRETYRCHEDIAQFLGDHIYSRDNLDYTSNQTHTLADVSPDTDGLEAVLDPDTPVTLLVHDENNSQQSNPTEAVLSMSIINQLSRLPDDDTFGVVTPHNAQRGLLTAFTEDAAVDTVERFQGGEENAILVSATASDPDFIEIEQDFLLNPNRLNVAISRAKEMAIVMVSKEVFNCVPKDTDKYDRARLWKGLYEETDAFRSDPDWGGTLSDFIGDTIDIGPDTLPYDPSTNIEIYTM